VSVPAIPRTPLSERDDDRGMSRTYAQVLIIEAAVIIGLWVFGRLFS
jgi:hypothetical protein